MLQSHKDYFSQSFLLLEQSLTVPWNLKKGKVREMWRLIELEMCQLLRNLKNCVDAYSQCVCKEFRRDNREG